MARYSLAVSPRLSLILASAFWGFATVLSKNLLAAVPPVTFLVIQLAFSVLALWPIVLVMRARSGARWRDLLPLAAIGFLNPGLSYTLSMFGLARTTASAATLLWAFEPILIIALAWLFLREAITPRLVMLALVATCGVLLVGGVFGSVGIATGGAEGAALILGGVLCCALYTVLSRSVATEVDPLLTVALQQTTGLAFALTLWPLELQGTASAEVLAISPGELFGAAVSGLMYYAAAFWLYLNGLRALPASTAGMFINLTPLFGVATAHVLLGERLTGMQWLGALMIVGSVAVLLARSPSPEASLARH